MTERPTRWARRNRSILVAAALMVAVFLLSGCSWLGRNTNDLGIDYRDYLPVEWEPLGSWQDVNIDDDDTVEHLLFYRYEGGQVGGVIYDPQTNSTFAPAAGAAPIFALPNQPSVTLIPYRLLPSYWRNTGEGFIAAPGQAPYFIQVQRPADQVVSEKDNDRTDELIIFGDAEVLTHLSVVWWQGLAKGYGVAHLAASGGLDITGWSGKIGASRVLTVDGYYPEDNNRSLLCRKITYARSVFAPEERSPDDYRYGLGFKAELRGLAFCPSVRFAKDTPYPTYTYYPEATVLAFLLHPRPERQNQKSMAGLVSDETVLKKIDDLVGDLKRVHSLTYYIAMLDVETSADTSQRNTMQMNVVAELVVKEGDQESVRSVTFVLQHQPPVLDPRNNSDRRSDRWLIVNAVLNP